MKILVISDTHGFINNAVEILKKEKFDFCVHLGDMARDCEALENSLPGQKFIFVKGNNEFMLNDPRFPDERNFELCGKRFFVCHGHKYRVKSDLSFLKSKARECGADIVLYGHTHRAYLETDPVVIMNPGSVVSYGVLHIEDGIVSAEIVS